MPHKITYSAVAFNARGNYVNERIWGDWMNIQADGFDTPEAAAEHGENFFHRHAEVATVAVCQSIQEGAGMSWRPGPKVAQTERAEWESQRTGKGAPAGA